MSDRASPKPDPSPESRSIFVVAIGLVLAVLVFDVWLLNHLDHEDRLWHRAMVVYKGIEALALAGAGFLFGREVNRERAQKAESHARDAETRAHLEHGESQKHKATLNSLIDLIETKREAHAAMTEDAPANHAPSTWEELARYAAKLRPTQGPPAA